MSRRKGKQEMEETDSSPAGGKSSGLVSALSFSTDPPYINMFDDEIFEQYSIMTSYSADGILRSNAQSGATPSYVCLNKPLIFNEAYQTVQSSAYQQTVSDPTLVGEVVFEYLDRIITTPGDISTADLKSAVTEYLSYACNLIAGWATTASLYGLADSFPRGSGQIKNYLSEIGCKPWQQEAKNSLLSTLPLPTNLVQYLTQWYAVKQIPDGRNVFCCPSQPAGLTADEALAGSIGRDLETFEVEYSNIQAITDALAGKQVYPEMRRILLNAGWKTYEFGSTIPVVRDGAWWDIQVVNMAYASGESRNFPAIVQCSPQSGNGRRTYALSVYGKDNSPWIERLLMPVYACPTTSDMYDRETGAFNTGSAGAAAGALTPISLGGYHISTSYGVSSGSAFPISRAQPAYLVVGNSDQTTEVGWADSITGITITGALATLYSEMANILETDSGSAYTLAPNSETGLYKKIFRGESTTVASNRLMFGNTIDPNMTGGDTIAENTTIEGDRASIQRIYEAFLAP